jgi:C4-dicarboxylate-specific signal transduction histidine kinase
VNAANLRALMGALQPILDDLAKQDPSRKVGAMPLSAALGKVDAAIGGIEMASQRIAAVLDTLKSFGRNDRGELGRVEVTEAVSEAVLLTQHSLRGVVNLTVELTEDLPPVRASSTELSQVFVNLIENAAQAFEMSGPQARGNGPAEIHITVDHLDETRLAIAVTDNGPGIEESLQEQIFRPYFTTRAQGEGTGLGLALSSDIVHRFGGELTVRSRRGQGASFVVELKRF